MICPECGHEFEKPVVVHWSGFDYCPRCGHVFRDEHPDAWFKTHFELELVQLDELFARKYPEYGTSWKTSPFHFMVQRLVGEEDGELKEFMDAVDADDWMQIRDEGLDCINVLFMIVNKANEKLGLVTLNNKELPHTPGRAVRDMGGGPDRGDYGPVWRYSSTKDEGEDDE